MESAAPRPARHPPLREDVDLLPGPRQGDGAPTWILHDPVRNRFFRIGWLEFAILRQWSLGESGAIARRASRMTGMAVEEADVEAVNRFLAGNYLLSLSGPTFKEHLLRATAARKQGFFTRLLHNYLFFRIPLFRPDAFLDAAYPYLRGLYSDAFARFLWVIGLLGLFLVSRQWDVFRETFVHFLTLEGMLYYGLAITLAKVCHELGHAFALKRHGLKVPTLGVAFLVMWPVLYTDAAEAWKLTDRRKRFAISFAGIKAELALAVLASFLWSFLPDGPFRSAIFLLAATTWIMTLMVNLNPFLRFDGYYLLSDHLDFPNLQERAFAMGRWWMRGFLWGWHEEPPESFSPARQRFLILFALGTWVYRFFLFLSIALLVYHMFFKVLGIFLMAVEIIWFLLRPIQRELASWGRLLPERGFTSRAFLTLLLLVGVLVLGFLPLQGTVKVPVILRNAQQSRLYSPVPARLSSIQGQVGREVGAGDLLFGLEAPDLSHELTLSAHRKELAVLRIQQLMSREEELEELHVAEGELARELANEAGIAAQMQRLTITAPFAGRVVEVADDLVAGRWVDESLTLAFLISKGEPLLEGFIAEEDLQRVSVGAQGLFVPDIPELPSVTVTLSRIDSSDTPVLDIPHLASVNGGPLPATADPKSGRLMSDIPLYRVWLQPTEAVAALPQVRRGVVHLVGKPQSPLFQAWEVALSVVIRESGF